MSDHCGSVTADGAAVCVQGACSCSTEAKGSEPILLSLPPAGESKNTNSLNIVPFKIVRRKPCGKKFAAVSCSVWHA